MPIVVRELAGFIGPGLYKREKTIVKKFMVYAVGLSFSVYSLTLLSYLLYSACCTNMGRLLVSAHSLK